MMKRRRLSLLFCSLFCGSFLAFAAFHQQTIPATANGKRRYRSAFLQAAAAAANVAWQSHVSTDSEPLKALEKVLADCTETRPDLALLFVGQYHAFCFPQLVQQCQQRFPNCQLLSVVGGGCVGDGIELDESSKPSLSLLTGRLPAGAEIETFAYNALTNPPPPPGDEKWKQQQQQSDGGSSSSSYFLLADPWSPVDKVLEAIGESAVVTGGISVPTGTGPTVALGPQAMPQGSLVGLRVGGTLSIQAVVAQGCRPVGPTFRITECEQNAILQLDDDKPAIAAIETLIRSARDENERRKISAGLVVGISADGSSSSSDYDERTEQQPDYLIRQITGFVPTRGGMTVSGALNKGDRLRFHVRDKDAAEEDLRLMVQRARTERLFQQDEQAKVTPVVALQISCVARGRSLFGGVPNVDLSYVKQLAGPDVKVAGFYANGEIGPVGLAGFSTTRGGPTGTFLHGFTTVVALLCERQTTDDVDEESPKAAAKDFFDDDAWG
jgi:small ligand-binding sensory domain FIST